MTVTDADDRAAISKAAEFLGWVAESYVTQSKAADIHPEEWEALVGSAEMARDHSKALAATLLHLEPSPVKIGGVWVTSAGKAGEADKYVLTLEDGSQHNVIVSNCEKAVAGDGGFSSICRAIARAGLRDALFPTSSPPRTSLKAEPILVRRVCGLVRQLSRSGGRIRAASPPRRSDPEYVGFSEGHPTH